MGVDLLPDERVLWQGRPVHRSVFLRQDPKWMWFSLKYHVVLLVITAVLCFLVDRSLDLTFIWYLGLGLVVLPEPFVWRFLTLRRTTYYVTNQRVVSVPGRRARATKLTDIDTLAFVEELDGSGHVRIDRRYMPDGFGNRTVAELIHVPDVREVVDLLATLTGQTATAR
jgi:hypothetical protein